MHRILLNSAVLSALLTLLCFNCHADNPKEVNAVTYATPDDRGNTIVAIPSLTIDLPKISDEQIYSVSITNGLHVLYQQVNTAPQGHLRVVKTELPTKITEAIQNPDVSRLITRLSQFSWGQQLISDHGYIHIPVGLGATIFSSPEDVRIQAVTPQANGNDLAVIIREPGADQESIAGIDLHDQTIKWKFLLQGIYADERISWISNDLLLTTLYGRKTSEYAVISIETHKIISQGISAPSVRFLISNGELFSFDSANGKLVKVFSKPSS